MKIIVTGGAGFIGSHIAEAYIAAGHKVIVIDNLSYGSKKNLARRAKFYNADIRNVMAIERIFKRERPEIVNHHAALISVRETGNMIETNVLGTANVLEAFAKYGAGEKKFIFPSSAAVYGDPKQIPTKETAPASPLSVYGLSKLLAEHFVALYAATCRFDCVIFRYANVYGPRQQSGVIPVFSRLMKADKKVSIFGTGKETRDFVHVSDIARANVLALRKGKNETMNLGTGKRTEGNKVFELLARKIGYRQRPVHAARDKEEIKHSALSPARAKKILGWKPKVKFEEGIKKAIGQSA